MISLTVEIPTLLIFDTNAPDSFFDKQFRICSLVWSDNTRFFFPLLIPSDDTTSLANEEKRLDFKMKLQLKNCRWH